MYNLYERKNGKYTCVGKSLNMYDCLILAQIIRNTRKGKGKFFYEMSSRPGEFYKLY